MLDKLIHSRRLMTFLLSSLVSIVTLVLTQATKDPFALQLGGQIVALVEGVAVIVIGLFTVDDTVKNPPAALVKFVTRWAVKLDRNRKNANS
jgi:hypothetical protein